MRLPTLMKTTLWQLSWRIPFHRLRIPVNVTADSGNVTGIPANVTEGRCCAL